MGRKVAIVHDWLIGMRGGEKVLESMLDIFAEADIFSLFFEPRHISEKIKSHNIFTSPLNKYAFIRNRHRHFLPLLPAAVESFPLRDYHLVISSSHCVAKGVIPGPDSLHICYIHSPMRYIWDQYESYFGRLKGLKKSFIKRQVSKLRIWDVTSSARVDYFVANSNFVKQRVEKYYRRDAVVIHPPVDTDFFKPAESPREDYFLTVSALVPYKNNHLLVEAFNRLREPLVVVGAGPEEKRLKKMAGPNITFRKNVTAQELRALYQQAAAFVYSGVEDFGIAFVEAQACGIPVIALKKGGVLDIVEDGRTGILYEGEGIDNIARAVKRLADFRFEPSILRENSLKFSPETFKIKIQTFIEGKQ
jgi:glycosyltransferase involved in cell wall biosynthesis